MNIEKWAGRRFYRLAAWIFIAAGVALWLPMSWEEDLNRPGTHIYLDFGMLKPLRATWQSSANGFWFAFSNVRIVALAMSAVLTVAAVIAARESYQRYGKTS